MKTGLLTIIFAILLLPICANATVVDVNFYSDATIEDGDVYGTVNIYDTPPDQTTVTMTGGIVESEINLYDTSVLNISGGYLSGSMTFINLNGANSLNLSGGDFSSTWIYSENSCVISFYGQNLTLTPYYSTHTLIEGYWEDGTLFSIVLGRTDHTSDKIVLHEIPEPCTFGLIGLGVFIMRRKAKNIS